MRNNNLTKHLSSNLIRLAAQRATIEVCEQRLLMSTYVVNTTSDAPTAEPGQLTLRQAIAAIDAHGGSNVITFSPAVFTPGSLHTINLEKTPLDVTSGTVTVNGPGAGVLAISGELIHRVLKIDAGVTVSLSGLSLVDGSESAADSNGNTFGGAIDDEGKLTINNCHLSNNNVQASSLASDGVPGIAFGGAIYSAGSLTITNSTLSSNTVSNVANTQVDFDDAPAGAAFGGAVYCAGSLTLTGDTISGNQADGLNANRTTGVSEGNFVSGNAAGGGVWAGNVTISNSTITGNTAQGGATTPTYSAEPSGDASGGGVFANGTAVVSNSTLTGNGAIGGAGGLDSGSSGGALGGGLYAQSTLTISNSTVSSNQAKATGYFNGDQSAGGGIYCSASVNATLTTVDDNVVIGAPPAFSDSFQSAAGGGIYAGGLLSFSHGSVTGNVESCLYSVFGEMGADAQGGGVYASQGGSIVSSTISGNAITAGAGYGGGGDYLHQNGGDASGGGVSTNGPLTITSTAVVNNSVTGGKGGDATNNNSSANGGNANGGGVYASAQLTVTNSTISGNSGTAGAGGAASMNLDYGAGIAGFALGGGIATEAAATISGSALTGNNAAGAGAHGGAVYGSAQGALTLVNSTITGNTAAAEFGNRMYGHYTHPALAEGGAIYAGSALEISSSTVSSDSALGAVATAGSNTGGDAYGGGIVNEGSATITSCSFFSDTAVAGKGAAAVAGPGEPDFGGSGGGGQGGAIFSQGSLRVTSSTFSADSAVGGDGAAGMNGAVGGNAGSGYGGAILESGGFTLIDSTLTGNQAIGANGGSGPDSPIGAGGGGEGGAIWTRNGMQAYDSTITGNQVSGGIGSPQAVVDGGGIDNFDTVDVTLFNTILSGNTKPYEFSDFSGLNLSAASSNNLIGTGSGLSDGVNGNRVGVDNPMLSPLGSYGGPTQTMLPLYNSPVVNAGNNSLIPAGVTTDQRGYARIVGSSVDIGADELQSASASGTVFNDTNGDGIRETGEAGIAGVKIYADLSNAGAYITGDPTTITNSSGNYTLAGLPEGSVIIRQQLPVGYRQSYPIGGAGEHVTVTPAGVTGALFADSTRLYISGTVTYNGVGQGGVLVYADLNNDGRFESNENSKVTSSNGSFAFASLTSGSYTFRIVTPAGDVQTYPIDNKGIPVTLGSGGEDPYVNFTVAPQSSKLTGTVIGSSGSYNNQGNTATKAFDGNLNTYFDAPTASGSFARLDFGLPVLINQISFAPRSGYGSRMIGGVFQASDMPDFSGDVVTLYTVTTAPATGVLTTVPVYDPSAYQYVRYLGPANSYCNIAEAEFFGTPATGVTLQPNGALVVIGTPGSDMIDVDYSDGGSGSLYSITTTLNGVKQSFSNVALQSVTINAGDGNNIVGVEGIDDNINSTKINITTGSGNDTITTSISTAGAGIGVTLTINTGDGNNSVEAIYDGQATITGGNGTDSLTAESDETLPAYATIYGGDGNDTLTAGGGGNAFVTAYGEGGDDTFAINDYQDTLAAYGGTGVNTFDMTHYDTAESTKLLTLDGLVHGNLTLGADIQNVNAEFDGNLTIDTNSTSNDDIHVTDSEGNGNVTVTGGSGNDTIAITGAAEAVVNAAGSGSEHIAILDASEITVNGGNGGDYIRVGTSNGDVTNGDPHSVSINGGNGNDSIYGFAEDATVNGGAGNDTINFGGSSALYLYGGDGDDNLTGEGGILVIDGGTGNDVIHTVAIETDQYTYVSASVTGGEGNDTIYAADGDVTTVNGGGGVDTAYVDPFDVVTGIQNFHYGNLVKLTGTAIGTAGSYRNHGTTIANAFDGNLSTYFDGPDASGDWVGLDLGSAKVVSQVEYAPRAGWESRMDGGEIQASNTANFSSGVVTLFSIGSTPTAGQLTTQVLNNNSAYRYYRYIGPTDSYCDIAELEFLG